MKNKATDILTIVIPVYEREDYFLAALESVLNQSVKCNLLVVDNASSTGYFKETCEKFSVQYIYFSDQLSMFANWNRCFENCTTEYVLLLGDDDILAADYVEDFLSALVRYPDMDLYYTNFEILVETGGQTQIRPSQFTVPYGYQENGYDILRFGAKYGLGFPIISCVFKKAIFSGYYDVFHASNDWLWIYANIEKLAVYGDRKIKIKYRKHPAADTNKPETKVRGLLSHAYIYEKVLAQKLAEPVLKKLSLKRARSVLVQMRIVDKDSYFKSLQGQQNIYSQYLDEKLQQDFLVQAFFQMPRFIARIFHILSRY